LEIVGLQLLNRHVAHRDVDIGSTGPRLVLAPQAMVTHLVERPHTLVPATAILQIAEDRCVKVVASHAARLGVILSWAMVASEIGWKAQTPYLIEGCVLNADV